MILFILLALLTSNDLVYQDRVGAFIHFGSLKQFNHVSLSQPSEQISE